MDTSTGKSVWHYDMQSAQQSRSHENVPEHADIVVIGGGVSGAIIAHSLAASGREIIVLDKRVSNSMGSTLASTAILQYELDISLSDLAQEIGFPDANLVYRESFDAWDSLCLLAEQFGESAGFSRRPSLCLASSRKDAEALRVEAINLQNNGLECEFLSQEELKQRFKFEAPAALFHKNAAQINPVKFTNQLFDAAVKHGVKIFNHVEVRELLSVGLSNVKVLLDNDKVITARKVIVACGYETTKFYEPRKGKLTSSYAAATQMCKEQDLWNSKAVIWETARPYHYMRASEDNRVIIGGGDMPFRNPFLRDLLLPLKSYLLLRKLRKLLKNPDLKFEYTWCGTFGESEDGMPYMGEDRSMPGVYFVLGCGGNGTTLSMIAAKLINKWLKNQLDPLMNTFAISR